MVKQKLQLELENAPKSASQAFSSASSVLNRDENLSVQDIVLDCNNSDGNQLSGKRGRNLRVFVLNMRGEPLMPTFPCRARKLLNAGKARGIQKNRKGFTPSIRKCRYKIQPEDLIWIDGKKYTSLGVHCKGTRVVVEGRKGIAMKKIERIYNYGNFVYR